MKFLVTGASGFVGQHLTDTLLKRGHEVRLLMRSPKIPGAWQNKVEVAEGDVTNLKSVQRACEGIDSAFHLAGLVAYKKSEYQKMKHVNVQGTQNVLDAAIYSGVKKFIHMSSVV